MLPGLAAEAGDPILLLERVAHNGIVLERVEIPIALALTALSLCTRWGWGRGKRAYGRYEDRWVSRGLRQGPAREPLRLDDDAWIPQEVSAAPGCDPGAAQGEGV